MKRNAIISVGMLALMLMESHGLVRSIRNGVLWRDINGDRIQAHGVSILQHNGVFYMLGEDRSTSFTFKGVNLYSSTDLMNWNFENTIIDRDTNEHLAKLQRIIERPCLLYNKKEDCFVVWVKYQNGQYSNNKAAVFSSKTINGKYTYHKEFSPAGYDSNDCSFFEDDDGTAYYISTNKEHKSLNLYKLTDDYLDAAEATILFPGQNKEAPVIFRKDDLYYMLCSSKTGWNPNQMKYCTSTELTRGWSEWQDIGDKFTFDTQPTDVITIKSKKGPAFFYVGDRWKDPGLPESKTIILPLEVQGDAVTMNYVHEFIMDVQSGEWERFDDNRYVSRRNWKLVSVSSEGFTNRGEMAFDADANTFWHSNAKTDNTRPHEIVINMGARSRITGFMYVPSPDRSQSGAVKDYQLLLSANGRNWNPVAGGTLSYWSEVYFKPTYAQYMKFICHSEFRNGNQASVAELALMLNPAYEELDIKTLYRIDNGGWENGDRINVSPGSKLELCPDSHGYGSYCWSGPNEFYSNTRSIALPDISRKHRGIYVLNYTDDQFQCHQKVFEVDVN